MRRTSGFGIGFASGSGWSMIASASSPASTIAANASSCPRCARARRAGAPSGRPVSASQTGDDLVAGRAQARGGAAQQGDAPGAVAQRAGRGGRRRGGDGGAHVLGRGLLEAAARLAGAGIDGVEGQRHGVYLTGSVSEPILSDAVCRPNQSRAAPAAPALRAGRRPDRRRHPRRPRWRPASGCRPSATSRAARGRPRVGARGDRRAPGRRHDRDAARLRLVRGRRRRAERTREGRTTPARPTCSRRARCSSPPSPASPPQRGRPDAEAEALLAAMERAAEQGDRAGWNDCDRRFHQRIAALTGNPVLLDLADRIAAVMDEPLWQRLRDDSIAVPGRTTHPPRRAPHDLRGDRRGRRGRRRALRRPAHPARAQAT